MPTLNSHGQSRWIKCRDHSLNQRSQISPALDVSHGRKGLHHAQGLRRVRSGRLSATSVQATGKIPPAPTPVMKQKTI